MGVVPATQAAADAWQDRRVDGSVTITSNDHDDGLDRRCSRPFLISIVAGEGVRSIRIVMTCGDDRRTEVFHNYQADAQDVVTVSGRVDFYEDADENASDLDGRATFSFLIQPD